MYVVAKACIYRNKRLKPGDPFDGTKSDTKLYTALGWITPTAAVPERTYTYDLDLVEALKPDVPVLTDVVKPKRTYRRRDLVAE